MSNNTPLYLDGKVVDTVTDNLVLQKHIRPEHFLRSPPGICFAIEILERAVNEGVKSINVICKPKGLIYRCDLTIFMRSSFIIDRGFGVQRALPLKYWRISKIGSPQPMQLSFSGF